ncbi:MAG: VanZ family protein [Bacilli bacterium]|nr:VanZ family protein [Bacilli bacterium]MBR1818456.1 VanZ family protein [Bacilli bacterium]
MAIFLKSIESAFILFPLIALFFTIPYIIYQYRKYGSIPAYRSFVIYTFLLYLLCSYFLVILPLPNKTIVMQMKTPQYNLIPLHFLSEIRNETSFYIGDFATYFPTLKNPIVYEAIFNILLLVPFGCYLKYYFNCNLKKTSFFSFCYSLFLELTQLTGLYFIYPRGYRVFDVDDLLLNTIGGIIGYGLGIVLNTILPTREKIDQEALKKGQNITLLKRLVIFQVDLCIWLLTTIGITIFLELFLKKITYTVFITLPISFLCYYILIPKLFHNATIAMHFFHVEFFSKHKISILGLISYYYFNLFIYLIIPSSLIISNLILYEQSAINIIVLKYFIILSLTITVTIYTILFLKRMLNKQTIAEKLSKIKIKSIYTKEDE